MAKLTIQERVANGIEDLEVGARILEDPRGKEAAVRKTVAAAEVQMEAEIRLAPKRLAAKLDARVAMYNATQKRIAEDPSLLAALDPSEYKRQQKAAEKAAEKAKEEEQAAAAAAAPVAEVAAPAAPAAATAPAPATEAAPKGGKGKAARRAAQAKEGWGYLKQ